jgi:hypothetical protein
VIIDSVEQKESAQSREESALSNSQRSRINYVSVRSSNQARRSSPLLRRDRPISRASHLHSPHAETTDHIYEFTATVASDDTLQRYKVLVLVANPCLAAINRAVRDTLGDRWFATQWHQSVVR